MQQQPLRLLLATLVFGLALVAMQLLRRDHRPADAPPDPQAQKAPPGEEIVTDDPPMPSPTEPLPRLIRTSPNGPLPTTLAGDDDRQLLRGAGIAADPAALLDLFRERTLTDEERRRIDSLVKRLGDPAFPVRRKTAAELIEIGTKATSLLHAALRDPDLEVRSRAEDCLKKIGGKDLSPAVLCAAARVLASEKPVETVPVLVAYLPFETNLSVAEEVSNTLTALALRDGKIDPALLAALESPEPAPRGAAADALCRANAVEALPLVRKLLQDPVPAVRLQAGLALASLGEKEAVPVLIALLDQLPVAQAWQAELLLCRIAEGHAPPRVSLGFDAEAQQKCREAWAAWWRDHAAVADLTALRGKPRWLGRTMVILLEAGRVQEVDAGGAVVWQVDGLQWPLDAQLLPGDRVLVAEGQGSRVTERNFQGDILWEKRIENPLMAQRLPNGNTFIATMTQMVEVDRAGKEVLSHALEGAAIRKAVKLPNGDMACVTSNRRFVRYDTNGKELQSFPALMHHYGGRLEVLPNGHVLLPQYHNNTVVECDTSGQVVWQVSCDKPIAAVRMANGHTLISFMNEQRAIEVDRDGREVWEFKTDTRVTRIWRR